MIRKNSNEVKRMMAWLTVFAVFAMPVSVFSQTQIKYHSNKYKPTDDVKVGRQAAAEVEQQMPILNDNQVTGYVSRVGQRLVANIPSEFQHPEFSYYFKVVNARDINAFALPGGPMYVNRGMIEAAHNEGEMAGVMAHELSHVALRHGTAQASKAQKYGLLAGILGIGGQILGGPAGAAAQIAGQGVGVYFLKFSREYETEADILGARIMANAGYDPRDLANMFKTIEQQSGGGGGGFLSDHPSPADRYARINQEAQYLRVNNPIRDTREFSQIQARLRSMGPAPSMAEIARTGNRYPTGETTGNYPNNPPRGRVDYPSTGYQTYSEFGGVVRVSVPSNWRELAGNNSVWFAPEGAYGQNQNQAVYTHGVNFGIAQTQSRNLQQATNEFLNSLGAGSGNLRQRSGLQRTTVAGRTGLTTTLTNINEATGQAEVVTVITTQLRNGQLFYMIAVAPENESASYQAAFRNILRSLQIND
ncbi:MAG TPA: M48 family metallopeptidase [Pyrinomonadaceae bacterium]|jgi:predicted Zn-dependent protease|nr:M48 family metallopeptidase [Pyrinomonadaceae bacterium]